MTSVPDRVRIMSRSGPEDFLQAVRLSTNSSDLLTAGNDWAITRSSSSSETLHYKDFTEAERLASTVEGNGSAARVLRDLATSRFLCTQPRFAFELCRASYRAHQLKQCTPAYVEKLKCGVKLARAVDTLCRPQMGALTACLDSAGSEKAPSKCLRELTAFDQCTEDW